MTLEEFRASRKTMTTRAFGDLVQDAQWEDDDPGHLFLVYADAYYIEIIGEEKYCLSIENDGWLGNGPAGLAELEETLFEFAAAAIG